MIETVVEFAPYLMAGYLAFCLGLISPGPNILAIIGTSMGTSRGAGVALACGVSTGSFVWASLAIMGITALMAAYAPFALVLKIGGGLYLLWLASRYLGAARSDAVVVTGKGLQETKLSKYYLRGLLIQLTNPKAILSWVAMISIVSRPETPHLVSAIYVLGCTVLAFVGHIAWAFVFSSSAVAGFYDRAKRGINATLGAIFGAFGFGLIVSAFKSGARST